MTDIIDPIPTEQDIVAPEAEAEAEKQAEASWLDRSLVSLTTWNWEKVAWTALLIAALLIDLVKRDDARGTWHASHFRWRIRTVIIAGVLYLVTFPLYLLLYFPGAIAWLVISIWFLYRIVTGMVRMNKGRPMEFST